MEKLYLSDSAIARIVQILQEGILMGQDITDLFRELELVSELDGETNKQLLSPAPEYAQRVINHYLELEQKAAELQQENNRKIKIIV